MKSRAEIEERLREMIERMNALDPFDPNDSIPISALHCETYILEWVLED